VAYAAAHVALRQVGHLLLDRPGSFALVWPPTGLAVYALLVAPRRRWWAVVAVALAVGVATSTGSGRTLRLAVGLNLANVAQAMAAAWIVIRIGGRPTLGTLRGALVLMFAPAAALAAVSGISHLVLAASAPPIDHARFWIFWAGSSLGIVFVTSLLVAWTTPARPLRDGRRSGVAVLGIVLTFAAAIALLRTRAVVVDEVVLLPPLLWAAFRFGPRGATLAVLAGAVAVFVADGPSHIVAAAEARGAEWGALSLQLFLGVVGACIISVAAVEEERRAAAARRIVLERAFDHTPDPAGVYEEDGSIVWVNDAMARELGLSRDALVGSRIWELTGSSREAWRGRWERVAERGSAVVEDVAPGPEGRPIPWEISAALVDLEGRRLMVSVLRDLSDRRRAEEASRLAALGTLAAGVAHEINNPLAYIAANVAHVRDRLAAIDGEASGDALRAETLDPLAEAEEGARRVRDIVRQLRAFARPDEQVGPVDPGRALRAALAMAQNEIRHRARIVADIAATPSVTGSENRLVQVFVNLLVNAAQAIPDGRAAGTEVRVVLGCTAGRCSPRSPTPAPGCRPRRAPGSSSPSSRRRGRARGPGSASPSATRSSPAWAAGSRWSPGPGPGAASASCSPSRGERRRAPPRPLRRPPPSRCPGRAAGSRSSTTSRS
jgi:PAS domain S-box-containing protein